MSTTKIGVIGGSGIYDIDRFSPIMSVYDMASASP